MVKTNKRSLARLAVLSGEEPGLISRTAAGNRAYNFSPYVLSEQNMATTGVHYKEPATPIIS